MTGFFVASSWFRAVSFRDAINSGQLLIDLNSVQGDYFRLCLTNVDMAFDLTPAAIAATPLPLGEGILVRLRSP